MPSGDAAPNTDSARAAPVGVDPTRASIARVYDAALNGKDNYEIDRAVLHQIADVAPEVNDLAWSNRDFLVRATRFLAQQGGITQFLDCGSGLPTAENTHQIAQRVNSDAHVVYVDNDPVVLAHGRALLEENEQTHLCSADIFNPREVLEDATVRANLDFTAPIALFQIGTLHHYDGQRSPQDIMREYVEALPAGSFIAVAHFYDPETTEHSALARKMEEKFVHSPMGSGLFRTREQIEGMFAGLEFVSPGLVLCDEWWPDGPRLKPLNQVQQCIVGGVARKP